MNLLEGFSKLPVRLRRALMIWSIVGLLVSALPHTLTGPMGVAGNVGFWIAMALACVSPYAKDLLRVEPAKTATIMRRRRSSTQARRLNSPKRRLARAA